jgi:hypoxanthine phosphoribosyltransferase
VLVLKQTGRTRRPCPSRACHSPPSLPAQVLCGAFMFAADLCRQMNVPNLVVDAVRASSYGAGTETTGTVVLSGLTTDVKGRHVVLVEDIVDTGLTIEKLKTHLFGLGAATVTVVTLLNKAARRKNAMVPDFVGFECPDEFVIGYGLDYAGRYRELSYIGVLRPEFI